MATNVSRIILFVLQNQTLKTGWENRSEIIPQLKKAAKEKGIQLSDASNADIAEYEYGKLLFEAGTMLFGVGELSASVKAPKILKETFETVIKHTRKAKVLSLKARCKVCAKILSNRSKLRDEFLIHNIDKTKRLLNNEWKATGKKWEVFIKDYEAHHVIPVNMLEESDLLTLYYNNGGKFDFNSKINGMILKKTITGGSHAYHPSYNRYVLSRLDKIYDEIDMLNLPLNTQLKQIERVLNNLIVELKDDISNKCIGKKIKLNELY